MDDEELKLLNEELMDFANTPEGAQRLRAVMNRKRTPGIMGGITGLMDVGLSINQQNYGRDLRNSLKEPNITPASLGDAQLQRALSEAQGDIYNTSAQLAPAELSNLENYFQDLGNAQATGQASSYGALAQAASLNRQKGDLDIAGQRADLINENKGRYDKLLGAELQNNASFEQRRLAVENQRLAQYNRRVEEAALLESTGRANLRNSIYNTTDSISDVIQNIPIKERGDFSSTNGDDAISALEESTMIGMENLTNPQIAGYYGSDVFGNYGANRNRSKVLDPFDFGVGNVTNGYGGLVKDFSPIPQYNYN